MECRCHDCDPPTPTPNSAVFRTLPPPPQKPGLQHSLHVIDKEIHTHTHSHTLRLVCELRQNNENRVTVLGEKGALIPSRPALLLIHEAVNGGLTTSSPRAFTYRKVMLTKHNLFQTHLHSAETVRRRVLRGPL